MVITVECPSCNSTFPVDSNKIPEGGVKARCSSCAHVFRVERPEAEPAPSADFEMEAPEEFAPEPEVAVEEPMEEEASFGADDGGVSDSPDDWVIENEETGTAVEEEAAPAGGGFFGGGDAVEMEVAVEEPAEELPSFAEEPDVEVEDLPTFDEEPVAEEPEEDLPSFSMDEEPVLEEPVAEPEPAAEAAPVQGFTFGKRDPKEKARRLARVLVSDMISYNPDRHENALANGTIREDFDEEIEKSWKEYVEQVGEEMAETDGQEFWRDALNDVLAKGEQLF